LCSPRNITLFSLLSLGGGYFMIKSRTLAEKQRVRAAGDYSVTVDRSGTSLYHAATRWYLSSFKAYVVRYRDRLYSFALKLLLPYEDPSDVLIPVGRWRHLSNNIIMKFRTITFHGYTKVGGILTLA
jgi:hypothetical protein